MKYVARKLKVVHETLGTFDVETEVPQFETLDEIVQNAGSEQSVIAIVNAYAVNASAQPIRIGVKSKKRLNDTREAILDWAKNTRRAFTLAGSADISKKEKVQLVDSAFSLVNDAALSDEEKAMKLLEMLKAAKS